MSRLWIGLAVVLCLGTYALGRPAGPKLFGLAYTLTPATVLAPQERGDQQHTRLVDSTTQCSGLSACQRDQRSVWRLDTGRAN